MYIWRINVPEREKTRSANNLRHELAWCAEQQGDQVLHEGGGRVRGQRCSQALCHIRPSRCAEALGFCSECFYSGW